jgi:peptidoglycan-associated lipoprotein
VALALALTAACAKKAPPTTPAAGPDPFPTSSTGSGSVPTPPAPPDNPPGVPFEPTPAPVTANPYDAMTVDDINRDSPLKPVFFLYDSEELDDAARAALNENASVLRANSTWVVTIEGHCDERGTAEYNLALGDRRALAAKTYLQSLGISAARLRTVSYGKEFPFDPGHEASSWAQNRRAHLMLTAKQ